MAMIFSTSEIEILQLLKHQLHHFFMLGQSESLLLDAYFKQVVERCEVCFSQNSNKYYQRNGQAYFNPYMSVQYSIFLYYFSNTIYHKEPLQTKLCDKIYYLNKALNGLDLFYAVEMPDFFMAEHPVGTVIGRAQIGQGFMFYQACTVGGVYLPNGDIAYPVIGENVHLYANASIIGKCSIGSNVNIGAGTLVKNADIQDNCNVFGRSPHLVVKPFVAEKND